MRVNPVTGRPELTQAEQARTAALKGLAAQGHATAHDLTTGDGPRHIQDLLEDYQRFVDQLTAGKALLKAEIPKEIILAKMDYIQERLRAWNVTVAFGRRARAQLEKELTQGLLHGGPAQAD